MNSTESRKYDRKEFYKFLTTEMHLRHDSANSYISYVNNVSKLLGKPIEKLASDETSLEREIELILLHGNRNWKYGIVALYQYYHNDQMPKTSAAEVRIVTEEEVHSIVHCDGKYIKDLETRIFRYMPLERYYNLIEDGCISLTHISHWEDPYEGFIYRGGMNDANIENIQDRIYNLYKTAYGQSWMIEHDESDVLWRAMANGKRGNLVRVQTTVRKLAESLLQKVKPLVSGSKRLMRIARIEYKGEAEFEKMLTTENLDGLLNGDDADGQLKFLFFKRKAFEAEHEVRVVVLADRDQIERSKCNRGDLLKFEVAPDVLVEEVLADPCMDRREYEQLVCRTKFALSDEVGGNLIGKSKLFTWPVIK